MHGASGGGFFAAGLIEWYVCGMSDFVEGLEPRTLFAAAPANSLSDLGAFKSDVAALRASLVQAVPTVMADIQALAQDVRGLPNSGMNHSLVATVRADELRALSLLKADAAALLQVGGGKAARAFSTGAHAAARPTDKAQALFSAALANLQSAKDAIVIRFANDVQNIGAKVSTDVSTLAASNPTNTLLQNDLAKTQADFSNAFNAMQSHLEQASTDFQQMMADLGAWR